MLQVCMDDDSSALRPEISERLQRSDLCIDGEWKRDSVVVRRNAVQNKIYAVEVRGSFWLILCWCGSLLDVLFRAILEVIWLILWLIEDGLAIFR